MKPNLRLQKTLNGEKVDRPPVILPSGLISSVVTDVLIKTDLLTNKIHSDAETLALSAKAMALVSGFENFALPCIMTVESEAYGGETEEFTITDESSNTFEAPFKTIIDYKELKRLDPSKDGRLPLILNALYLMNKEKKDLPLIGDLVAPLSLATSLVGVDDMLKSIAKGGDDLTGLLDFLVDGSMEFMLGMVDSGVDVFFITEPFINNHNLMSGEDLEKFSVNYLNLMTEKIHKENKEVIIHCCYDETLLKSKAKDLNSNALSVDHLNMSVQDLRSFVGHDSVLMGAVDLNNIKDNGSVVNDDAWNAGKSIIDQGIDILSPACGVNKKISLTTIKSFMLPLFG